MCVRGAGTPQPGVGEQAVTEKYMNGERVSGVQASCGDLQPHHVGMFRLPRMPRTQEGGLPAPHRLFPGCVLVGHLFYKFGITESDWYRIKQSIDSKCRTAWRRKQRGQSLAVKSFSRRTPSSSSYSASGTLPPGPGQALGAGGHPGGARAARPQSGGPGAHGAWAAELLGHPAPGDGPLAGTTLRNTPCRLQAGSAHAGCLGPGAGPWVCSGARGFCAERPPALLPALPLHPA